MRSLTVALCVLFVGCLVLGGCSGKAQAPEKTPEKPKEVPAEKAPEKKGSEPAPAERGGDPGAGEEDEFHRSMKLAGQNMEAIFKALDGGDLDSVEALAAEIRKNTGSWHGFTPKQNVEQIEDYRAGCKEMEALLDALAAAGASRDGDGILEAARNAGNMCEGCHQVFKPEEEDGDHGK